jgi:hypothetical protein
MADNLKRPREVAETNVDPGDQVVYPLGGLENLKESVWLVKIPPYICEQWANAKHDEVLGSFRVAKTNDGKRQFIVQLNNDQLNKRVGDSSVSAVPKDLVIAEVARPKDSPSESLIAVSSTDKKHFHVENRVTKRFNMRPQNRSELAAIMKEREMKDEAKKTMIEVKEVDEIARAANNAKTIALSTAEMASRSVRQRRASALSEAMEAEIRRIALPLLKNEGLVSFKALWGACKNIEGLSPDMLREALKDFAYFNSSGPNNNLYELAEEYQGI